MVAPWRNPWNTLKLYPFGVVGQARVHWWWPRRDWGIARQPAQNWPASRWNCPGMHFSLSGVMWINNGWDGQRWVHFKCALRLGTWISYDKVCSEKLFADGQNWGNNEQTLDFVRSPTTCWYYVGWFCWVNVAICTVSRTSDESALSSGSFSTSNKFWAAITRRHNLHPTTLKTLGHSKLFSGGQRHLSTYSGTLVE